VTNCATDQTTQENTADTAQEVSPNEGSFASGNGNEGKNSDELIVDVNLP